MEKVKITAERADAIESYLSREHFVKDDLIEEHFDRRGKWDNEFFALNEMSSYALAKALYIGYEVEPEYEVDQFVRYWANDTTPKIGKLTYINYENGLAKVDNHTTTIKIVDITGEASSSQLAEEKERRFWNRLDRGNDEYRMTDVVQHKDYKGLYEVVDVYDTKHVEITDDFCDTSLTTTVDKLKLVCPAEKRLDVKTNE